MGFAAGFNVGWQSVSEAMKERKRQQQEKELADAMSRQPEQSTGFTAEQGDQLRAAAESGQYDIAYDEGKQGYTVTPKVGGEAGLIAQQGVTDFMGKRTAGTLSSEQVAKQRDLAVLDVLKRQDPMTAFTLQRQMAQDDMAALRFGQEQKRWAREDDAAAREDEYRAGREQLLRDSPAGKFSADNASYQQQMAQYQAGLKAGKSPQELGEAPKPPSMQRPGPMQMMAGYADLIAHDYKFGKLNTDGLISFQDRMQKLEQENYGKALLIAQNGGSPQQIAKAFNAAGMQVDPKAISISKTKQANGPDLVTLHYADANGQQMSIPVMAELEAYDKAKQVYDRFYQGETNRRGNAQLQLSRDAGARADAQLELSKNADSRAALKAELDTAEAMRKASDAVDKRTDSENATAARVALAKELNPGKSDAWIEAVRTGVIDPLKELKSTDYKVQMSDVASAFGTPAVDADGKPQADPFTGRQVVNRNVEKELAFFKWMADNNIKDTNKGLALYLGQGGGVNGGSSTSGTTAQKAPVKVSSREELAKLKPGDLYIAPDGTVRRVRK